jgi:hypothetical protein
LAATLRIDAVPGPRRFQGVWLELADGQRWLVDYRARDLWRVFDGAAVYVTGHCYVPFGQAINAPHFAVETLGHVYEYDVGGPYRSMGPELTLTGEFTLRTAPAGSKLAGSPPERVFVAGDTTYALANPADAGVGAATVIGRVLVVNLTYAATADSERLSLLDIHEAGWVADPNTAARRVPCPR